jgi:DNA-directed RNA polymerase specialized sigma24 family protein
MLPEGGFRALIQRVRGRDEEASAEVVRLCEGTIRRVARGRLKHSGLARLLGVMDICQAVLADLFAGVARGQFELRSPQALRGLVATMARNRITDQLRKRHNELGHRSPLRAGRWEIAEGVPDPGPGPEAIVAQRDLARAVLRRLSEPMRHLADQWCAGQNWAEIAAGTGDSADALRKRLTRGLRRAALELGLKGSAKTCRDAFAPPAASRRVLPSA